MENSKILRWYYLLAAAVLVFILFVNYNYKNTEIGNYDWRKVISLNDGWFREEDGVRVPVKLPIRENIETGKTYTLITTLPKEGQEGSVLCFKSNHLLVDAYIDGQMIYSYGVDRRNTIGKSPGCVYCFIPVKTESFGKEIRLEYRGVYEKSSKHITGFFFGEKTTMVTSLIRIHLFEMILCALLFFMGVTFIMVYLIRLKSMQVGKSLFYLGLSCIPTSIWSLAETQVLQFFIPNVYVVQYITYLSLGMISLPFLYYCAATHRKEGTCVVKLLSILFIGVTAGCLLLQMIGQRDLPEVLWVIHGCMALVILYAFTLIIREGMNFCKIQKMEDLLPRIPMIFLLLCGVVDLIRYYIMEKGDYSKFARIGFIVYIASVGIKEMLASNELKKEKQQLENLAYTDSDSGLFNSMAFALRKEQLKEQMLLGKHFGIAEISIRELKRLKEMYGERAKEEEIKTSCKLVELAFQKCGTPYKVRDDLIIVIIENDIIDTYKQAEEDLIQRLNNCNQSRAEKIQMSCQLIEVNSSTKEILEEYIGL